MFSSGVVQELKIHGKDTCYVIPDKSSNDNIYRYSESESMPHLENNVAERRTLEAGTYRIKIRSGWYSYTGERDRGEPLVVLWMFGHDNQPFLNKNTGREVGTTWTTLNGLSDALEIEVRPGRQVTVCALFLDVEDCSNAGGRVELTVDQLGSPNQYLMIVNSSNNLWKLKRSRLESIRRPGYNSIQLQPGGYEIKIASGQISYWQAAQEKKFELEPWALLWIKGGQVIPKYPSQKLDKPVSESWCSLNGYKETLTIQVHQTTTLSSLFFDTLHQDNEGEVVLSIRQVDLENYTVGRPGEKEDWKQDVISVDISNWDTPEIWQVGRERDVVCVAPVRSIIRREEEITLIRKVRKVEEIDATTSCPINTTQISPVQQQD